MQAEGKRLPLPCETWQGGLLGQMVTRFAGCAWGRAVHVVGTLVGARDFDGAAIYCHFNIMPRGSHWTLLTGASEGETQVVDQAVRQHDSSDRRPSSPVPSPASSNAVLAVM